MSSTVSAPLVVSYTVDDDVLTLDGTAVADSTVTIFNGTTSIGTSTANAEGAWVFTTGTLANGTYSITTVDSLLGNSSAASSVLNVVVDSPPAPVIDSGVLNSAFEEVLVGTAEANSTVVVFDGTTELGTAEVNSDGAWSFTTGALSSGACSFTATNVDAAGNISPASSALTTIVNTTSVPVTYFGMTIESFNYNFSYLGGPVEAMPTIPVSIARSWNVWSPGNGQIEGLDWGSLNPSAGVYNWAPLDTWIASCQANNAQMVYTFGNIPAWVYSEPTVAQAMTDFQSFVTAIVEHANGSIKYWEGLNEIDASGTPPAVVAQMQEIIYNTVHTLDPGALVLSPTVSSAGADGEFAQFLADGGGNYFDIAAFHGYGNSIGGGILTTVQDLQATLAEYGLQNRPIWDTEWGLWGQTNLTATEQEAFVSTGLIVQAAAGVQTEIFYAYDDASSSLYNTATGQLTAAGVAFQQTEQWLTGATEPSGCQLNGSVSTVQLIKNGQSDLIVWNSAGQSSFSAGPYTQYLDTQGQLHSVVNGVVPIGTVPILLETPSTPAAPVITSDTVNSDNSVTLIGTAEANSTIAVYDGQTALGATTANASGAWTYTTGTLASGSQVFTATATNIAGVTSATSNTVDPIIVQVPMVASLATSGPGITNGNGDLTVSSAVTLTLNMSEAVAVAGGTPTLTLNDGGTATYTGGSSGNALTFSYTVAAGQNTADLTVTAVNLNGATITDVAGNNASFSGTLAPAGTLQIDTTPPTVTKVTAAPSSGDVESGATVMITLTTSEVVNITGTPALALSDGGAATYLSGSGTNALVFVYTAAPGQNTTSLQLTGGVSGGSITDGAGNAAVIAATNLGLQINYDQWNKAISANWNTAADWSSPAGIPASFDLVSLNAAGKKYTVTSTANETIAELNTVNTATLAIASGVFTIIGGTGAGVQAGTISIAKGATLNIAGLFNNTGTLLVNGGTLNVEGVVTGGTAEIGGAGRIVIAQADSENIAFLAKSTGQLVLDQATSYTGEISGFGTTQSIDLADLNFAAGARLSYVQNNGSGVLTVTDGTNTAHLLMAGTHTLANYHVASDGKGGTLLTDPAATWNKIDGGSATAVVGGDFEGLGVAQLAASEAGAGTYLYVSSGAYWTKISGNVYTLMTAGDFYGLGNGNANNTDLAAYDPGVGTYIWSANGGWTKIDSGAVTAFAAGNFNGGTVTELATSETGAGTYLWAQGAGWTKIGGGVYTLMAAGNFYGTTNGNANNTDLAAYAPGIGTYIWSAKAGWTKIDGGKVTEISAGNFLGTSDGNNNQTDLAVFCPGSGTYIWSANAGWMKIDSGTVGGLAALDLNGNGQNQLLAYFPNHGVYEWQAGVGWSKYDSASTLPTTAQQALFATGNFQGGSVVDAAVGFSKAPGIWLDPPEGNTVSSNGQSTASSTAANAPVTVNNGAIAELNGPSAAAVTFAGASGTLQLDRLGDFSGTVAGFGGQDRLDLTGIAFSANSTLGYSVSSNKPGGSLAASDGVHAANVALLGSYMASSFVTSSDGHGGTLISEAAQISNQTTSLSLPHATT